MPGATQEASPNTVIDNIHVIGSFITIHPISKRRPRAARNPALLREREEALKKQAQSDPYQRRLLD
jgi:hypothetical protein